MICKNCGLNNPEGNFCANCGTDLRNGDAYTDYSPAGTADFNAPIMNPVVNLLNSAAKNNMFLSVCILLSISAVANVLNGVFPKVLPVLYIVFTWMIFAAACKDNITYNNIRNVSGTIKAEYIINYISVGLILTMGVLFVAFFAIIGSEPEMWAEVLSELEQKLGGAEEYAGIFDLLTDGAGVLSTVIMIACLVVAALTAVVNVFIFRPIWRFVRSLCISVEQGRFVLEKANKTATVIMVYGIISVIATLGATDSILNFIAHAAQTAAIIVGSLWLKKYVACYEYQGGYEVEEAPQTGATETVPDDDEAQ